jgi:MerR family transcriptional regulator/heat shock protein HspR
MTRRPLDPTSDPERAVYVISVAAELAGVHPQTLRIYERKGLVEPSRTGGGSRRYSLRDVERLRHIQDLTSEGLNLQGVRRVLELEAEVERLRAQVAALQAELERTRAEAREQVERTHRQYRRELVPVREVALVVRPARRPGFGRGG